MWSVHMEFVKMHGLGNDFIILDDKNFLEADIPKLPKEISALKIE